MLPSKKLTGHFGASSPTSTTRSLPHPLRKSLPVMNPPSGADRVEPALSRLQSQPAARHPKSEVMQCFGARIVMPCPLTKPYGRLVALVAILRMAPMVGDVRQLHGSLGDALR